MGAIGNVDAVIVNRLKALFEERCLEMLECACQTLKAKKNVNEGWGEENITANLYVLIHDSQKSIEYDIHPDCDHLIYDQDILDNKKKAKTAHRIDLVFQHNWNKRRFSFYVEAKNLIENDYQRSGHNTKKRAVGVLKRYIETGIDHYITEYYPLGCMLGYVLNGTINGVVYKINKLLLREGRTEETLRMEVGTLPWICYSSMHKQHELIIKHYLFDFSN